MESDAVFYCHKDIENLDCPTSEDKKRMKPCKGWAQHAKKHKGGQCDIWQTGTIAD
ncbi:hypothetical protein [Acinetobacter sp. TUM15064]|uniref:hypothetical protein n=1 Tax=Acinetobacter sp. TUM15064 TaxID=2609134 RepID=UPI001C06E749|nr:hypothetical protein [Acinetobacter sp. TUM15064]